MHRTQPRGADYVFCYALYALLLLAEYAVFWVWHTTALLLVGIAVPGGPSILYATVMILIGLALFGLAMSAEPYLRDGVRRGALGRRFARLALPVVAAILLGIIIQAAFAAFTR